MSIRTWFLERLNGVPAEEAEKRIAAVTSEQRGLSAYVDYLESLNNTNAGVAVTPDTALTSTAVFACVRVLAETIASLPLKIYEHQRRGRAEAPNHSLYRLLHDRPNDFMTAYELRETLQGHLALWGNAYCDLNYQGDGQVTSIWPMRPDKMIKIETFGEQRIYYYQLPSGQVITLDGARIWHLRGLGSDGLYGYSPIEMARNSIGLGLATEKFGSKFFGNGARPGGVLQHPQKLSPEAYSRLRASWNETHGGLDNAQRVAILEEGMTYHSIGIPPEDAQFLETRKFQTEEIARIFRVPLHMIGDLDRATFSNIEHLSIEFVVHNLRPWLVRWEQSVKQNLMTAADRKRYYAEHVVDALLRGDTASRYQAYAVGWQNGWLSANDIRERENMNPIDGGDIYMVPLNMIPADQVGLPPEQPTTKPGAPVDKARSQLETHREERAARSARARHRLAQAHLPAIQQAAAMVVKREIQDVGAAARKYLSQRDFNQFSVWLEDFYRDHPEFTEEKMRYVLQAYGENVAAAAGEEVEQEVNPDELQRFLNSYVGVFAARQAGISLYRLRKALEEYEDDLEGIEAELESWSDARAAEIAREQTTRMGNAVAKMVFVAAGVMKLRWMTMNDTCPYCQKLNGTVVEVNRYFLMAGQQVQPDGTDTPLTTTTNIGHPPAHDGCDCVIVAA